MKYPAFLTSLAALSSLFWFTTANAGEPTKPAQTILISFDGAHALSQWERSRAISRTANARFTYFISCAYLLSPETKDAYRGPGFASGKSNVGFGESRHEIAGRLRQIWAARLEGHEIASHGCGHFDGKGWTKSQWTTEHAAFTDILSNAWTLNRVPFEPKGWKDFASTEITGFRAPYLSTNKAMFRALHENGFQYDASGISRGPEQPQVRKGLMRFALPTIPEGPRGRRIIAMDYNLFVRHSAGLERPSEADVFAERTYDALMAAFRREHSGKRRPLSIGFHFTLMNGGAYWDALERFAAEVCGKSEVACITHSDYLHQQKSNALGG